MAEPTRAPAVRWPRLLAALLAAAGLRLGLVLAGVVPFNADEAVVGLMARHILQGERPVFFYGQAYLGSLDAWLVAGGFLLFGQTVLAIRLVQVAVYLGTIATTYLLGLRIYRSQWVAGAAAVLLAVPPVLFTLYSTISLGGYGEVLLLGNLCLLLALRLLGGNPDHRDGALRRALSWLLLGGLGGLGFWSFPLILVYLLPILALAAVLYRRQVPRLAVWLAAFAASQTARRGRLAPIEHRGQRQDRQQINQDVGGNDQKPKPAQPAEPQPAQRPAQRSIAVIRVAAQQPQRRHKHRLPSSSTWP